MNTTSSSVITVTKENFESEVLNSEIPVFLDFWAGWCMPCNMAKPEVEKLANTLQGTLKVGSVDVDEQLEIASAFGVRGIPMFALMKGGKVLDVFSGFAPAIQLQKRIEDKLANA